MTAEVSFVRAAQNQPRYRRGDAQIVTMVDMLIFFGMCAAMLVFTADDRFAYIGGGANSNMVADRDVNPLRRLGRR